MIYDKSFKFAIRIVNLYKYLVDEKKEYTLSKQVLRSGTSIGANVKEAQQGSSRKDFLNKMNIALKEANETNYWIDLLTATNYIEQEDSKSIKEDSEEILKMLISIVKSTKLNTR